MGKLAKHCRKCGYIGRMAGELCCEYCVVTGHIRGAKKDDKGILRPIPASECTHWNEGKKQDRPRDFIFAGKEKKSKTENRLKNLYAQIEKLYEEGLNDREIAEELRCSKTTVRRWRQRNNAPSQTEAHRFAERKDSDA